MWRDPLWFFVTSCARGVIVKGQTTGNRGSNLRPSKLRSDTLTITLQEPYLQGILLSLSLSLLWLQRAGFSMACSCGKTIFQALKKCFFHTCPITLREAQLCKKKSGSKKMCFFRAILWNSKKPGFATRTIFQTLKHCFLHTNLMKFRQAWLCKKNNVSGSKNLCFSALLSWNSNKPGFAKKQSGSFFFRMPLVKSANSTSLPRLSSLQIVQMHAIHNQECPKNLRDPRPVVV